MQRPERLFVFADGPPTRGGDEASMTQARQATERVDWPCEVHRDYATANLGVKRRVESGMRTLFEDAGCEAAILLEDDCVPDRSFFPFCAELLDRYRTTPAITTLCGSRLTPPGTHTRDSYAFTRYAFQWGWATWRRAWRQYDSAMGGWLERRRTSWLTDLLCDPHAVAYWTYQFDRVHTAGEAGDWDIAWLYSSWIADGLSIVPAVNLVANIGFGAQATHTRDPRSVFASLPVRTLPFPLQHPSEVRRSEEEDRLAASTVFSGNLERLMRSLRERVHADEANPAGQAT